MSDLTNHMKSNTVIAAFVLSSLPAFAGSPSSGITTPEETSPWEVRTALYGWAQGLDGDLAVRGRSASVDLGFDDVVEDLDFAVMGVVEISRGRWSFMADANYAESSTSDTFGPVSVAVGDIGGFGIASDLTWQAMAGFGWRIMDSGSLLAGY